MPYLLLASGIALLLTGGTLLVRGASGIARGFNVSTMIIGLTVVAFAYAMHLLSTGTRLRT